MKNLFVSYELAVLAKEKGFNEKCISFFDSEGELQEIGSVASNSDDWLIAGKYVAAPLYQQLVDWFRTKDIRIMETMYGWQIASKTGWEETHVNSQTEALTKAFKLL